MARNGPRFIVTGTDTGIGKSVFSAGLTALLDAEYWKPVQAGLEEETDSDLVKRLGSVPADRIHGEGYRLRLAASPHHSAAAEGVAIDPARLVPPDTARTLVIEGAGGALVPLTDDLLFADLFARWNAPAVIVARTTLGTINHSLMTLEALRSRDVPVLGIAFIGDAHPGNERTICAMGQVRRLGRLPLLKPLSAETLAAAMRDQFDPADFAC
ncbi:MAG: dethiobiotin synthase [Blastomonas sp.]